MINPSLQATDSPMMKLPGLYSGQVEAVEDDDFRGRIMVSIPSIYGSSSQENLMQARPCFPYGHFFVPEVGDQVWLAFENGDPKAPVWLGIWYPEGKTPEVAQASPPNKRVMHSSSDITMIFDDENEKLIIKAKGNQIEINQEGIIIDSSQKEIVIKASSVDIQEAR